MRMGMCGLNCNKSEYVGRDGEYMCLGGKDI